MSCKIRGLKLKFLSWKEEFQIHKKLILIAIGLWILANVLNVIAGAYADKKASYPVTDIILDNIPSVNLEPIFTYGFAIVIGAIFLYPLFFNVKETHVAISQMSLLVAIRSIFVSLTHLKVPPESVLSGLPKAFDLLTFQNDLFFSGHVAIPFLGFLMFRKEKIGKFFLIVTSIMAITVLLMHVHYSIDVFAALFITYGSFKMGGWIFKRINHY